MLGTRIVAPCESGASPAQQKQGSAIEPDWEEMRIQRQPQHHVPPPLIPTPHTHVAGHGQEAGEISVAALKLGKADVLSQITHELGGAGEVGVLTNVGVNAAVAGVKAAADSFMEATTHLAGCQPCSGGACAAEGAGKSPPPALAPECGLDRLGAGDAFVPLSHPPL